MNIDFKYVAIKFARDAAAVLVGSEVFTSLIDTTVALPSLDDVGRAAGAALCVAAYRLAREFGLLKGA